MTSAGTGFAEEEHIEGEKEEHDVGQEEFEVDLPGETAKTPALDIDASNHGHGDEEKKSYKKTGKDKRAALPEKAPDDQNSADDLDPGQDKGQNKRDSLRKSTVVGDVLGKIKGIENFYGACPDKHPAEDETENVLDIAVVNHFWSLWAGLASAIPPSLQKKP